MSKKAIAMKYGKPVISLKDIENVRKQALFWVNNIKEDCPWDEVPHLCLVIGSWLKKLGIAAEIRVGINIRGVEYCNVLLLYITDMEWPEENFATEFVKRWNESHIVDEFVVLNEDEGNARHVEQLSKIIRNACQNLANYVRKQTNEKQTKKQPKNEQQ